MMDEAQQHKGWIEVICGSMFSGKTEELMRRVRRAKIAKQKVLLVKPETDTRYHNQKVVTHSQQSMDAATIKKAEDILNMAEGFDLIAIDEAQFLDEQLAHVCNQLADANKRVIVAGLDMDFEGKFFRSMPHLLASAEYVSKLHAICMDCGSLANYSMRITDNTNQVQLGAEENYEPLCRSCFNQKRK